MLKPNKKIFALLILASIFSTIFFISCQDPEPVETNNGQYGLSKVTTFVMPAGASLVSANLKLYSWSWTGTPHNVDVHSVTADWTCPAWNDIATSFDPTIITSFDMSGIGAHWETVDITATVQGWLSGGTNFGLMLKNQDPYAGADKLGQFLSNDYAADPTLRPFLEIVTTAGTFEVEPLFDTYINSINPDLTYCSEEKLYIGYVDLGTGLTEKRPLVKFDIENCPPCVPGVIGGIDLAGLVDSYLFFFADGHEDANWQGASKGYVGNVLVDGIQAKERTSGYVPYAGTISTDDGTLSAWQNIVDQNVGQALGVTGENALLQNAENKLMQAFATINALSPTAGFESRSSSSLNNLNFQNGSTDVVVINVISGFQVSSQIYIYGDAGDAFILRWDTDADFSNGYQGQVKFQSGGAIVPMGDLKASNFVHVAGNINASGGGSTPPPPYPQGPRFNNGQGSLISGGQDFNGGGFFTGYWLTTGNPDDGKTSSFSNAIFVGGWYTITTKFSMTSGTSGVHVVPECPPCP